VVVVIRGNDDVVVTGVADDVSTSVVRGADVDVESVDVVVTLCPLLPLVTIAVVVVRPDELVSDVVDVIGGSVVGINTVVVGGDGVGDDVVGVGDGVGASVVGVVVLEAVDVDVANGVVVISVVARAVVTTDVGADIAVLVSAPVVGSVELPPSITIGGGVGALDDHGHAVSPPRHTPKYALAPANCRRTHGGEQCTRDDPRTTTTAAIMMIHL
jgi:hypothetical protein